MRLRWRKVKGTREHDLCSIVPTSVAIVRSPMEPLSDMLSLLKPRSYMTQISSQCRDMNAAAASRAARALGSSWVDRWNT